jgi:type IV secretory pathway VirB3-like protein
MFGKYVVYSEHEFAETVVLELEFCNKFRTKNSAFWYTMSLSPVKVNKCVG